MASHIAQPEALTTTIYNYVLGGFWGKNKKIFKELKKKKSGLELVEKMADQKGPGRWEQRSSLQQPESSTDGARDQRGDSSRTPAWLVMLRM